MKILVVDDEQDVKELFEQRFRKEIRDNEMQFAFVFQERKHCNTSTDACMKQC